jgi:DNA-directed RNA polymerase specialized sigma24 family protein
MPQANRSLDAAAVQALIPELLGAARDLVNGSTISPDGLAQDALKVALKNWDRRPAADELKPWLLGILRDLSLVEQHGAPAAERG